MYNRLVLQKTMKRLALLLAALTAACSTNPCELAEPVIDAYLLTRLVNPDTFTPTGTSYLGTARVDREFYDYSLDGPCGDSTDVQVFVRTYTLVGRSGGVRDGASCLYLTDDYGRVLCYNTGNEPRKGLRWINR